MTTSWATLDANLLQLILTPLRASSSLDDRRACGRFRSVCSAWRDAHDQSSTLLRLRTAGGRTFNFRRGRWPNVTTVGGTRPQTPVRAVSECACAGGRAGLAHIRESSYPQSQTSIKVPSLPPRGNMTLGWWAGLRRWRAWAWRAMSVTPRVPLWRTRLEEVTAMDAFRPSVACSCQAQRSRRRS
jgi:hypothetical protein